MQTATNTELITFQDWTLRVRPSRSFDGAESRSGQRLMLMIHGWTGDENSMWVFARGLSPDYWIIAPRAPHPGNPSGYSWRVPDPATRGRPTVETLKPALDRLMSLVDAYSSSVGVDAQQFDLMGFSQGAAMVNLVGLLHPERVRKMAVLAGFIPAGAEELIAKRPLEGKTVFVAHGTEDQMVTVERARASIAMLEQAGAQVTYCEDDVGHKLGLKCFRALESYFSS